MARRNSQGKQLGTRSKSGCKYRFELGKPKNITVDVFPASLFLILCSLLIMCIPV
jgi:hypothetical protein